MKIVGLGLTVLDLISVVDKFPQIDSKQEAEHSLIQVGGPVPTALAQLTRLGRTCSLISAWGDDPLGQVIEANLDETGISFSRECRRSNTETGFSQVWVERSNGQRTTVTQRPTVRRIRSNDELSKELVGCEILHLDGWPTQDALFAARTVKAGGGRVLIDTGSPKPGIQELLSIADYVNAPRRFIQEFLEESDPERGVQLIAAQGPSVVTVTDGEQGAWLWTKGEVLHRAADRRRPTVDTNGAGDVFTGAMIHALLSEWSPEQSLSFAVAAAGLKCTRLGNRDALPNLDMIDCSLGGAHSSR